MKPYLAARAGVTRQMKASLAAVAGVTRQRTASLAVGAGVTRQRKPSLAVGAGATRQMKGSLAAGAGVTRQMKASLVVGAGVTRQRRSSLTVRAGVTRQRKAFLTERDSMIIEMSRHSRLSRQFILEMRRPTRHNRRRLAARASLFPPMRHRIDFSNVPDHHLPRDARRVGRLVASARGEIGLLQRALAEKIDLSLRSVQRLERGESPPGASQCLGLLDALSEVSDETWNGLVEALELPIEPELPETPPPATGVAAPGALDHVVRGLADDLDVPANRLRAAFEALLAELERQGISVAEARPLVAPRARTGPEGKG